MIGGIRAGVVKHPSEWAFCGYNEIQAPRERYALIDYEGLLRGLLGFRSVHDFAEAHREWVEKSVQKVNHFRDGKESKSFSSAFHLLLMPHSPTS